MTIAVIDYGSGNLHSAAKAIELAAREKGETVTVTGDAKALKNAKRIVLPGVGAFADCKRGLSALPGMIEALEREVIKNGKPFLGICVGMQLMAERGLEDGVHKGLGWIKGEVRKLTPSDPTLKIPHMNLRNWGYDGFAEDSWQITPNTTINFGVRYRFADHAPGQLSQNADGTTGQQNWNPPLSPARR